jgi:hypothetical protein
MSSLYRSILNAQGSSFASTNSFEFDGSTDYIDCGNGLGDSQSVITAFSVSMWIKPIVTSGNDLFFNIGSFANSFGQIAFQLQANKLYVKLNNGQRSYNIAYTNTTAWQHLVFVYDGSNSANTKMYLDNVEQSPTVGGVFPSSLDLTGLKTIIGAGYSVVYPYAGLLDEVSYFDRTLSASDVNTIYGTGVPNNISSLSPLSWWRMGESANYAGGQWTLTDQGSGGNDGTSSTLPAPPSQPSTDVPT